VKTGQRKAYADRAAIGVSLLCLVHCLLLPIALALLPAAAGWLDVPEGFHLLAVGVAIPVSAIAIVAGYRRHGILIPGVMAVIGLSLISLGAFAGFRNIAETIVTVLGSLFLATGHLYNWRAGVPNAADTA
jgi:hypothetical protein